jgi:hypothetical protein
MQGPTEAFIPTKYVVGGRVVGGTMRRKNGIRTLPLPARAGAETPALPPYTPPQHPPPQLEDEALPAAKKQRLQAPCSNSTAVDRVTTDSSDDTPTNPVTPAASLPSAAASRTPRRSWTAEEDTKLTEAVKKHGKDCWVTVAALVPGRTNLQCRNHWVDSLDPANGKKGKWKPEEDTKLTEAVKNHGNEWAVVSAMVPGRTDKQCRRRWVDTLDPTNGKNAGKWTPEEDAKLAEAVKKHGKKWVAVAMLVPGRTDKQCRDRWVNTVDPTNGKITGKWTPEEDTKLTEAVKKHGNEWAAVSAMVSGRTNLQCRDRWVNTVDPTNGKITGKWTPEEDTKLTEALKKHGKNWAAITAMVPGRTDKQCRQRWVITLNPANVKKGK